MRLIRAFVMSLGMFSTLPVPKNSWNDKYMPLVVPNMPVVGLLIGLLWYGLTLILVRLNIPALLLSAAVMLLPLLLSGFLHVDGYMDTADAIFSRRSVEEKRRILKDPHVGAFAVIALMCMFLLQYSAVCTVVAENRNTPVFIFIPVISRCVAGIALLKLKPLSDTGFAAIFKSGTGSVHINFVSVVLIISLVSAGVLFGTTVFVILLIEAAAAGVVTFYVCKQLEGISGDLCGCIITVCEMVGLIAAAL